MTQFGLEAIDTGYVPVASKEHPDWFEIPEFSGYCANRKGQLLFKRTGTVTYGGNAGRYLKVGIYKDGYARHSLYYVHDLVCRAFYGKPQRGWVVLHLDNNRRNNTPTNLRWGTQSENTKQAWDDGLRQRRVSTEALPSLDW